MPTKTAVPMWKTPAHTRQERQSWIPDVFAISEDSGIILYPALDYYHSQYLQVHISWSGVLEAKGRRNYSTLLYTSWNSLDRTASTFIYASILSITKNIVDIQMFSDNRKQMITYFLCYVSMLGWSNACVCHPAWQKNKTILDCVLPVSTQILQKTFLFWKLTSILLRIIKSIYNH